MKFTEQDARAVMVGCYGQDWRQGVLSEHMGGHWDAARRLPGGTWVVVQPDGRAERIVCSELIRVDTEDGPVTGRCGRPVTGEDEPWHCDLHRHAYENRDTSDQDAGAGYGWE